MMDTINPSTGEVHASAANSDAQDVDAAFRAAGKAFEKWRWSTPSERQRALLRLADVIGGNAEELVAIESDNTGTRTVNYVGGDTADGRSDPFLRRCRGGARGEGLRGVHEGGSAAFAGVIFAALVTKLGWQGAGLLQITVLPLMAAAIMLIVQPRLLNNAPQSAAHRSSNPVIITEG